MKNEEAIEYLNGCAVCDWSGCLDYYHKECDKEPFYKAVSMATKALKKQIPRKPKLHEDDEYSARCPDCGSDIPTHWVHGGVSYCECCGQKISWEENG